MKVLTIKLLEPWQFNVDSKEKDSINRQFVTMIRNFGRVRQDKKDKNIYHVYIATGKVIHSIDFATYLYNPGKLDYWNDYFRAMIDEHKAELVEEWDSDDE